MAKHDSSIFCIANDYAKDLFDLNMNETNIQDSDNNVTRFLVIGKKANDILSKTEDITQNLSLIHI